MGSSSAAPPRDFYLRSQSEGQTQALSRPSGETGSQRRFHPAVCPGLLGSNLTIENVRPPRASAVRVRVLALDHSACAQCRCPHLTSRTTLPSPQRPTMAMTMGTSHSWELEATGRGGQLLTLPLWDPGLWCDLTHTISSG